MDFTFLAKLAPDASLGDLQLDNVRVATDDTAEVVKRLFEERKDLAGLLVVRGAVLEGVLSRETFLRYMTRPFFPEIFTHRPLRLLLEMARFEVLRLPESMSMHEAAHCALQRPHETSNEPLVVELTNGDFRLLGVTALLLSQSRLLELANDIIYFQVRDTEIGIEPDKVEGIFRAFEQADGSINRRYGGTGLGLSISARLVEMMHGRIWVDSTPGQGSTFHFTARFGWQPAREPLRSQIPPYRAPLRTREETPDNACGQAWGLRILLAEDNPVNQTLAVLLLQKRGHEVTVVDHGRAAVDRLQQETFDVVLMDVQMPVMDGFEATRLIRQRQSGGPRTPIVAMTAHALKGDRERCLETGMDSYVSKPIAADHLYQAIEDALAAAARHGSEPPASSHNDCVRPVPDLQRPGPSPASDASRSAAATPGRSLGCRRCRRSEAPRALAERNLGTVRRPQGKRSGVAPGAAWQAGVTG